VSEGAKHSKHSPQWGLSITSSIFLVLIFLIFLVVFPATLLLLLLAAAEDFEGRPAELDYDAGIDRK
jgi:hypothetical protein